MINVIRNHWPAAAVFMFGLALSLLITPAILATSQWYEDWYSINNPPATLRWNKIERLDADTVRFSLLVTRHRDCEVARVAAYTGKSTDSMRPADHVAREDGTPPQSYPVGITVVSKPWLVRGIFGDVLAVAMYYECDDHLIKLPLLIGSASGEQP